MHTDWLTHAIYLLITALLRQPVTLTLTDCLLISARSRHFVTNTFTGLYLESIKPKVHAHDSL